MYVLDLFSGIGGFSLGLERAGFETVAFCEINPFCRAVLKKHWPDVPCFDDVCTLSREGLAANGISSVDVICGGFPCQDASIANTGSNGQRKGIYGARAGLWTEIKRLAAEFPDAILFLENVPGLLSAGFGVVLGDLASLGYDAEWFCVRASELGLPHRRERLIIVAYARGSRWQRHFEDKSLLERTLEAFSFPCNEAADAWRELEKRLDGLRGSDGLFVAMERRRLHGCGNAFVPQIPEIIGRAIKEGAFA